MSSQAMIRNAYAKAEPAIQDPRRIEYAAFAKVTQMLMRTTQKDLDLPVTFKPSAIHENRRLWTTIAALVSEDENQLPQDLRARLFYLAEFVEHHSKAVFTQKASVDPLIEINKSIMLGLSQKAPS